MGNKIRGVLDIETSDKTYQFKLGTNAIVQIEEELDMKITQFDIASLGFKELRAIIWAGLHRYHPELTKEDVGDIVDEVGFEKMAGFLTEGLAATFPSVAEASENGAGTSKKKKSGTGKNS